MNKIFFLAVILFCIAGCRSFEEGYDLGRSDSVKELYWAYQELQKEKNGAHKEQTEYYVYEGQTLAPDGTHYIEHKIKIPVIK